jgi:hypothetical protein
MLTIWLYFSFPHSIVDDAYIHARYAQNLAEHGQLNWNVSADPVEGYTGILMPLVYAALFKLGFEFEASVPVIGLACFWVTGMVLNLSNRQEPAAAVLAVLFYCLTPCLYRHIFSGMETVVFACLLTLAFALASPAFRPASPPLFGLTLLLLALVRPEGLSFALTLAVAIILTTRSERRKTLWIFLLFILPYAAYFLWRWGYYGQLLPNPYYVKSAQGWNSEAITQIGDFFIRNSFTPALAVLAVLGLALWLAGQTRRPGISPRSKDWLQPAAALLPLAIVLLQYARSNLSMNYSHRFLAPYIPLLLLVMGNAIQSTFKLYADRPRLKNGLDILALGLCGLGLAVTFPAAYRAEWREANLSRRLIQGEHIPLGRKLRQVIPPRETLVVLKDAGAVPYYSGLPTIDLGGLNDEYLARNRPSNAGMLDYVFQSEPGVFVITSYSPHTPDRGLLGGDQRRLDALLEDKRFEAYPLVEIFHPPVDGMQYYEFVYLRRDLVDEYFGYTQ